MTRNNKKGFTLVEIMIVVVIIGLLAAMAIPAFQRVRSSSQDSTIENNLRNLASAADSYFMQSGNTQAASSDIIGTGTDKFMKTIPAQVSGENYAGLFPINQGFTELSVTKNDGTTITFSN